MPSSPAPTSPPRPALEVEIWSDVVCPWCYIGKRRFEAAVAEVSGELDVRVVYRPYQLDPTSSTGSPMPVAEAYARKFGGAERAAEIMAHLTRTAAADGLAFRMDLALRANTFDAHRLLVLAEASGAQAALKERLLHAYFMEGLNVADADVLAACAADAGMDRQAAVEHLAGEAGVREVRAALERATELGISAVPTYVFDGVWAVPGAQDAATFTQVMRRFAARRSAEAAAAGAVQPAGSEPRPAGDV